MEAKLSLTAAFDDLMRKEKVLQKGIEAEFRQFVLNQERCRQKWSAAEAEVENLQSRIHKLEEENSSLQTRLKHARHQIEGEVEKRVLLEKETKRLENQVSLITEILNDRNGRSMLNDHDREKLASLSNMTIQRSHLDVSPSKRLTTINESTHSILSDCEYDKTEEELHVSQLRSGRVYKRPSAPPLEEDDPPKKRRSKDDDHDNSIVTTTTVTLAADGKPISAETEIRAVKKLNKSFSEPALDKHKDGPERDADSEPESEDSYYGTPRNGRRKSKGILKNNTPHTAETPALRKANSASKGLNRVHFFMSKTILKPETCAPCGKRIKFGKLAMKCKDCRSTCHPECRDSLPLPCVPTAPSTPGAAKAFAGGTISDFAPVEPPMIPAIVVHCVNEVEARGLTEVGIYRVPGAESQVKDLKKEFLKGKGVPNLSHIDDINVVCGCMKDFLRGLKEPLITYALWQEFVRAAENRDPAMGISETYQAISRLPQANRDTLAFLILHLMKVSECKECKMPVTNLAKVFGPTIIGYSVPDPEPLQMISETKYQAMVMEKLFALPVDYWESYLNIDTENMYPNQYNTPKTPEGYGPQSMLGPLHTPGSYERRNVGTLKNAFTPSRYETYGPSRFANKTRQMTKKPSHFFDSPVLN